MISPQNSPVQNKNHIQTWTRPMASQSGSPDKTTRKTKMKDTWHVIEY